MASNSIISSFQVDEPTKQKRDTCFKALRKLPRPVIIAGVIFYIASVLIVGLLAGLLPRRTQQVIVLSTSTLTSTVQSTTTITTATTTITTNTNTNTDTAITTITTAMITTSTTTTATSQDPSICIEDECNPRLSSDIIVQSYELEYICNDTKQTAAQGRVTIKFTLRQPTKQIIYHAKGMIALEEPALFEDELYRVILMREYTPNDYISIRLSSDSLFAPNRYTLVQKFITNLIDGNVGFYQSTFNDKDDTTQ